MALPPPPHEPPPAGPPSHHAPPYPSYSPAPPYPGYGAPYSPVPQPGPAPGLAYAGFWIRFVAHLVDGILLGIPLGIVWVIVLGNAFNGISCTTITGNDSTSSVQCTGLGSLSSALLLPELLGLVLSAAYFVAMWAWQGQTVGQKVFGLHVVDAATGQRIGVGRAIGRYVGYIISSWVLFIGLIWAAFDARKQGWHDKMASTFVVKRV